MRKFKNTKKLLTLAMASTMVMASTQVAFAANDETDTTITITEAQGKEYKAFKLMELVTDGEHFSYSINAQYKTILINAIQALDGTEVSEDKDIIAYLEQLTDPAQIRTFADKVYMAIKTQNMSADLIATDGVFSATQGYYLIAETGEVATGKDRTLVMLDTLGQSSINVTEKRGVPQLDKVIVENGSEVEYTDLGLNKDVTYQLKGTMPENIASYGKYKYIMHDSLPDGVTYKEIVSIKIGDTTLSNPSSFEVKNTNHCSVEIKFDDIKATAKELGIELNKDTTVIVQYKATLNDKAVVGNPGNQNTAYLEFSNDPYDESSTENTPSDDAKVFTFSVVVNKVDKDKLPLAGAEFKLQMKVDGTYTDLTSDTVEYIKDSSGTKFTFEGLDVGEYKLVETKVPSGYNKADDVEFRIAADYENTLVKTLTVFDKSGEVIGQTNLADDNAIFSVNAENNGTATTDIINTTGIKLPSTGSTGAIMVYCASGIALTVGIASFVTAKKRKKNEE